MKKCIEIGTVFGRLTVDDDSRPFTKCTCSCGTKVQARATDLRSGGKQSCGCLLRDINVKKNTTHDHYYSLVHNSYNAMMTRCYNTKCEKYLIYGGRGITVCERWRGAHGFENFLADMGERPQGKTLDRKDVNGNYEKDNCKWSTAVEQRNNRRDSK